MTLSHGQEIVLGHYLVEYPPHTEFEDILQMMQDEECDSMIWCKFEDWDLEELTNHMRAIARDIDAAIVEAKANG
jgi:hypothetical protein